MSLWNTFSPRSGKRTQESPPSRLLWTPSTSDPGPNPLAVPRIDDHRRGPRDPDRARIRDVDRQLLPARPPIPRAERAGARPREDRLRVGRIQDHGPHLAIPHRRVQQLPMPAVVLAAIETCGIRPRQQPAGSVGIGRQRPERPFPDLDLPALPRLPRIRAAPQPLPYRPDVNGIGARHRWLPSPSRIRGVVTPTPRCDDIAPSATCRCTPRSSSRLSRITEERCPDLRAD